MPLHVSQFQADAAGLPGVRTAVGDARELDLPDASADAVLLLGPLYHLTQEAERSAAILDGARALESVPELAGFGPHLLATAIR